MDNVIYAVKQKQLQCNNDHMFFLCLIRCYLEKPECYTVYEGEMFEDFCIGQFVASFAECYLEDLFPWRPRKQFEMRLMILSEWEKIRKTQKVSEAYLKFSFAEDVRCSISEMRHALNKLK